MSIDPIGQSFPKMMPSAPLHLAVGDHAWHTFLLYSELFYQQLVLLFTLSRLKCRAIKCSVHCGAVVNALECIGAVCLRGECNVHNVPRTHMHTEPTTWGALCLQASMFRGGMGQPKPADWLWLWELGALLRNWVSRSQHHDFMNEKFNEPYTV